MSSLPLISHHLFVAAIDEPGSSPSAKVPPEEGKVIEVEILDWTEPVPEVVALSPTPPSKNF